MSRIDRTGTFRGVIEQCGIGDTKAGAPMFVASLRATEYWDTSDADNPQWIDWSMYDECEANAYLVLVNKDGDPIFHAENLMKAVGWDGSDWDGLAEAGDKAKVQWRMIEDDYNGKPSIKVSQIDHYDAEPGGTLRVLDKDEVKKLNAKFAKALKKLSGGAKPKPVGKPDKPAKPEKTEKPTAKKETKKTSKKPSRPPKSAPKEEPADLPAEVDEDTAWVQFEQAANGKANDDQMAEVWLAVIEELGGAEQIDADNTWAKVRDTSIERLS